MIVGHHAPVIAESEFVPARSDAVGEVGGREPVVDARLHLTFLVRVLVAARAYQTVVVMWSGSFQEVSLF